MAKDPAFLFYPGDYLRDTQCFSEATQVAYDRIMCEHMRNICITKQQLKFFTKKLSPAEIEELMLSLTEVDGGFQISWVAESIVKRRIYSENRAENRRKNKKNISKTYVKHMENEIENANKNEYVNAKEKKEVEFETYEKWTQELVESDHIFHQILMKENLLISPQELVNLTSGHLELLARYPNMQPTTVQKFRLSAINFIKENKNKPKNGTKTNTPERKYTSADFD